MLSATLEAGLSDYAIGGKIRALRLKKKMGLVELGQHSGMSPALLSKLERGRLYPTLPTLLRIALVFSVGLDYFFAGARAASRASGREGHVLSLRVAGLSRDRAAVQLLLRRVPSRGERPRPVAHA